jgi:NAD(P)-dependent dehydrogenase (short-subunit alcohol dehydrogenase family)
VPSVERLKEELKDMVMDGKTPRVVLITGASSGIGKACAIHLSGKGYRVYGTSRSVRALPGTPSHETGRSAAFEMIPMDVNSEESVERAVEFIVKREKRLDVLVNCAGYGLAGAAEDTGAEEAHDQVETNFFGVFRLCRNVLPIMRRQRGGYIVNISSIGGLIGIPFQSLYSASKFALEGFTEALRTEVHQFGIRVVLIEPGDFRTGFTAHRSKAVASEENPVYKELFAKALGVMEADEMNGPTPEKIGPLLERIITTRSPKPRYRIGPASERLAVELKKVMPARLFEWAIMKYYRLR